MCTVIQRGKRWWWWQRWWWKWSIWRWSFCTAAGRFDLVQRREGQRFHRHRTHPGSSALHLQYGVIFIFRRILFEQLSRTQNSKQLLAIQQTPVFVHHLSSITVCVIIIPMMIIIDPYDHDNHDNPNDGHDNDQYNHWWSGMDQWRLRTTLAARSPTTNITLFG